MHEEDGIIMTYKNHRKIPRRKLVVIIWDNIFGLVTRIPASPARPIHSTTPQIHTTTINTRPQYTYTSLGTRLPGEQNGLGTRMAGWRQVWVEERALWAAVR